MTTTLTHPPTTDTRPSGERRAALSGLAFVVLLVVHATLQSSGVPTITDPGSEVLRYLTDSRDEILLGVFLQGLAIVAFLWFLGSLWRALRRTESGDARLSVTAATAGAALVGLIGVHIAIIGGLALRADEGLDPSTASLLWTVAFAVLGMNAFTTAALTGAIGALVRRSSVLPGWLGTTALLNAGLWVLAGVGAASDADVWGAVGFLAFLSWLVWTAAASVALARRSA